MKIAAPQKALFTVASAVVSQAPAKTRVDLSLISDEDLMKVHVCDLPLKIDGTWLQDCIGHLYQELDAQGIIFKPLCYLADEWLTPTHETVIGIPFYLAHPRLTDLERRMMLEAEGETKDWCMKLLRHETGHAIAHAYQLNKKKKWQKLFGPSSAEYPETYRYRPYSRNYVRHLEGNYAQYHPDEDFVETFAVWLTPNSNWQQQYKGWKALEKLAYVDQLMQEMKGKQPPVKSQNKFWRLSTLKMTLENFYKKKREFWAEDFPDFHDTNLRKIFAEDKNRLANIVFAGAILERHTKEIINTVSLWTGERKYVIGNLLRNIQKRCRELKLMTTDAEPIIILRVSSYVTTLVMNYLYTGRFRGKQKLRT